MEIFVLTCTFLWIGIYFTLWFVVQKNRIKAKSFTPPVSVIIAAKNEAENLRKYLVYILSQHYPEFEVIIAVNQTSDNTTEILQEFKKEYPFLQWIETEPVPENISPKKHALTQAIQQSKYEHLLFTDADCIPNSPNWITHMVIPFTNPETEIVLGYSPYKQENSLLNSFIQYETLFTAIQYLGLAKSGMPYMGVGRNLAYKKSLFEKYTFNTHADIFSGDDDLFVNQVANKTNTDIQTHRDAWVYSVPEKNWHSWYRQKSRHLSTGKYYKPLHLFVLGIMSLLNLVLPFLPFLCFLIREKFYIFAIPLMLVYLYTAVSFKQYLIKIKVPHFILLPFMYSLYQTASGAKGIFSKKHTTW